VILLVGTRSSGKQREVRRLLAGTGIDVRFPDDVGVIEGPAEEALELADRYEANACAKAEYFHRCTGLPTLADDSGLEVIALGGAPGVRSKRWTGVQAHGRALDEANNAELLRRLQGAPAARRRARFRCVLAYVPAPGAVYEVFEGTCPGTILEAPRGTDGFGYDPLFLSDALGKTLAEASDDEKDRVSHRGIAFQAFRERLARARP
jgi:XTP/dITP diphosphohydrolase